MDDEKNKDLQIAVGLLVFLIFVGVAGYFVIGVVKDMGQAEFNKQLKADQEYFSNNGSFICRTSFLEIRNIYLVSKKSDWEIYNNRYYKKGDFLIGMENCKRVEKREEGEAK